MMHSTQTHPDHPRSRGVYAPRTGRRSEIWGSSPLARGLPSRIPCFGYPKRIIPARAGFTAGAASTPPSSTDHPRSRGVYGAMMAWSRFGDGSSPLARGLRLSLCSRRILLGIIPARAGFTLRKDTVMCIVRDHPRSRGVYMQHPHGLESHNGSSPLARGLRARWLSGISCPRIIPARAGFTCSRSHFTVPHKDHPRSRGVYP